MSIMEGILQDVEYKILYCEFRAGERKELTFNSEGFAKMHRQSQDSK